MAPEPSRPPLRSAIHAGVLACWLFAAFVVAAGRGGDIAGALVRELFVGGAWAQVVLVPLALLGFRVLGPRVRHPGRWAHGISIVIGFGPLLLLLTFFGINDVESHSRAGEAQRFVCENLVVTHWRLAPDPEGGAGTQLVVQVYARRATEVRLDYVNSYSEDGRSNTRSLESGPTPMVKLWAGDERAFVVQLEPPGKPTAWLQFTLCTAPGWGTESCGWFGFGKQGARPSTGALCPLPPPTASAGASW